MIAAQCPDREQLENIATGKMLARILPLLLLATFLPTNEEARGQSTFRAPTFRSPPTFRSAPSFRSTPSYTPRMSRPAVRMPTNAARLNDWSNRTWNRANQAQDRVLQKGQLMNQQAEERLERDRVLRDFQLRQLRDSNARWAPGTSLPGDPLRFVPSTDSLNSAGEAVQMKRYGVVTIYNPNEVFINYSLRWGSEGEWEYHRVLARGWHWHSCSWDCSHAREFPTPYICFDATFTDDQPEKEYALETNVALATGPDYGKPYHFIIEDDGVHIDLKQGPGTSNPPAEVVALKPLPARLGQSVPVVDRPAVKYGWSIITFDNQSGQPASVRLVGPTRAEVDVPSFGKNSIRSVAPGSYLIRIRSGTPGNYRYGEGDRFDVVQTATSYSHLTITLHPTPGGNYHVRDSSAADYLAAYP